MNPLFILVSSIIPVLLITAGIVYMLVAMAQQEFKKLSYSFYIFLVVFGINVFNYLILNGNSYTLMTAGPFVKTLHSSNYYIIMLILSGVLSFVSLIGVGYYYRNGYIPQIFVKATLAFGVVLVAVFVVNVMNNRNDNDILKGTGLEQTNPSGFRETGDLIENEDGEEKSGNKDIIQTIEIGNSYIVRPVGL